MPFSSPLQVIEAQTGDNPTATVLILHGLGADGRDFLPVAEQLDLSSVGPVRFLFPSAPSMPVTLNGGYVMPAWYDILGTDLVRREDEGGLRAARTAIEAIVANEINRGISARRIVVAGFSQGCAMALMTGLLEPQPCSDANADVPSFMAHGTRDGVVPIARAEASRDALLALGYPVQWQPYAMEHSVCPQEITDLQAWLLRVLA